MNYKENQKLFFIKKCKGNRLKITPQREAIFFELSEDKSHPTAQDIYKRIKKKFSNISFDTVNRTLIVFAQSGVIKITEGKNGARRYDPETTAHHHFHCIKCNKIIDFENKGYDSIKLPKSITEKHQVLDQKIVLDGICQNCKNTKRQQRSNNNY